MGFPGRSTCVLLLLLGLISPRAVAGCWESVLRRQNLSTQGAIADVPPIVEIPAADLTSFAHRVFPAGDPRIDEFLQVVGRADDEYLVSLRRVMANTDESQLQNRVATWMRRSEAKRRLGLGEFDGAREVSRNTADGTVTYGLLDEVGSWNAMAARYHDLLAGNDIIPDPNTLVLSLGPRGSARLGVRVDARSATFPDVERWQRELAAHNASLPPNSPNRTVLSPRLTGEEPLDGLPYLEDFAYRGHFPAANRGRLAAHDGIAHGDNAFIPAEYAEIGQNKIRGYLGLRNMLLGDPQYSELVAVLRQTNPASKSWDEMLFHVADRVETSLGNYRHLVATSRRQPLNVAQLEADRMNNIFFDASSPTEYATRQFRLMLPPNHPMQRQLGRALDSFVRQNRRVLDANFNPQMFEPRRIANRVVEVMDSFGETAAR